MSLMPLETKNSPVKLEIHESRLPRSPSSNHPHQLLVVSLMDESPTAQRHAGECQSSPVWARSTENWQQLLCSAASHLFVIQRDSKIFLCFTCHPLLNAWISPHIAIWTISSFHWTSLAPSTKCLLFSSRVSKCDFLDLALTVHIHWASLNILYFL